MPLLLAAFVLLATAGCAEMQSLRANSEAQARRIDELQKAQRKTATEHAEELHQVQADLDKKNEQLAATESKLRDAQTLRSERELELDRLNQQQQVALQDRDSKLEGLRADLLQRTTDIEALQKKAKELQDKIEEKTDALAEAKKKNDAHDQEAKQTADDVADLKKKLAAAQKAAEKGAESDADLDDAFSLLRTSLKPLVDTDFAFVTHSARGVVVGLKADYIFEKGAVTLDAQCHPTLDLIAEIFAKYPNKYVEVQGHTDPQPVTNPNLPYADNWALSSARAYNVIRFLTEDAKVKIRPEHLKSTSCSQYRPPEATTGNGEKLLRRVEFILSSRP